MLILHVLKLYGQTYFVANNRLSPWVSW